MKSLVFAIPEKWNYGFNTPCNIGKNILNCRAELTEGGKKTGYILKDDKTIALIGYREQPDFRVVSIKKMDNGITA